MGEGEARAMRLSDFDFHLPDELIALRPANPRDSARLLVVKPGAEPEWTDQRIPDLLTHLRAGDVMVFNDTRVIPARLHGVRRREDIAAKVEIMLHKRDSDDSWVVFARPAKKLAVGDRIRFGSPNSSCLGAALDATVAGKADTGEVTLRFDLAGPALDQAIVAQGEMPLPPYIAHKRTTDEKDAADYQTVYAVHDGAVAAPTAGLHFTEELLAKIDAMGVQRHFVTLHVGAGTFLPVKTENIADHRMHAEWGRVDAATAQAINAARSRGGRIIAVGTTSLRLLESAAQPDGTMVAWRGDTDIFISPGYRFRAVDMLMTNFHLPKSTLMILVSAFAGNERMRRVYAHAITNGYRFYSYGDSSLLHRADA
jgi:S-adenosylmethionine:tRNA ribosyltransferase-isomerase